MSLEQLSGSFWSMHWSLLLLIGIFLYCNLGYCIMLFSYKTAKKHAKWDEDRRARIKPCFRTWICFPVSLASTDFDGDCDKEHTAYGIDALLSKTARQSYAMKATFFWPAKVAWVVVALICLLFMNILDWIKTIEFEFHPIIWIWQIVTIPVRWLLPKLDDGDEPPTDTTAGPKEADSDGD